MEIKHQDFDAVAPSCRHEPATSRENPREIAEILSRLERIESALDSLVRERLVRDYYSTSEVAEVLRRAEFTVREWCRLGRIKAEKKRNGRGLSAEWVVSHDELLRIQREGLLPIRTPTQ
jgi:hypothetical protein